MAKMSDVKNFGGRRRRVMKIFDPVSRTKQADKDKCDINLIVKRFVDGGIVPEQRPMLQGDFTAIGSYQEALNAVMAADEAFMNFPAEVRSRFANDPQKMLDFISDDKNYDEAVKLGLLDAGKVSSRAAAAEKAATAKAKPPA